MGAQTSSMVSSGASVRLAFYENQLAIMQATHMNAAGELGDKILKGAAIVGGAILLAVAIATIPRVVHDWNTDKKIV